MLLQFGCLPHLYGSSSPLHLAYHRYIVPDNVSANKTSSPRVSELFEAGGLVAVARRVNK